VSTNVEWTNIFAKFTTVDDQFIRAVIPYKKTLTAKYEMPNVKAVGYMDPNYVSEDFPYVSYKLILTNKATEEGNKIKCIKIIAPSAITNIMSVTNLSGLAISISNYRTNLYIYYQDGLNIGQGEVIVFTGYDNISGNTNYLDYWQVYVYNTTDGTKERKISTINDGLLLNIMNYNYIFNAYLDLQNSIGSGNLYYSTYETNKFRIKVDNVSSAGNNIKLFKLNIPNVYVTNTIVFNTSKSNINYYISNNSLWIDCVSNKIGSGQSITFDITILDNIKYYETNITWELYAVFDRSYSENYIHATIPLGRSMNINYIMPDPSIVYNLYPTEVYLKRSNFVLHV